MDPFLKKMKKFSGVPKITLRKPASLRLFLYNYIYNISAIFENWYFCFTKDLRITYLVSVST